MYSSTVTNIGKDDKVIRMVRSFVYEWKLLIISTKLNIYPVI